MSRTKSQKLKVLIASVDCREARNNQLFSLAPLILGSQLWNDRFFDNKIKIMVRSYANDLMPIDFVSLISKNRPDVICLGVYIWNVELIKKSINLLKRTLPRVIIILGGSNNYTVR